MSCEGTVTGAPLAGLRMLWLWSISTCASRTASLLNGRWTAIWSPSKSALNGVHANGCNCNALPSISFGWNAITDKRCSVGARFSRTGWPFITFSRISQITDSRRSTIFLALFTVFTMPRSISLRIINGLYSSAAINFGRPHSPIFSSGPTTITERAE